MPLTPVAGRTRQSTSPVDRDPTSLMPGVPLVESPVFASLIESGGFESPDRDIALQLNERGFAVIDFPDPEIGQRIDRIKDWLSSQFGLDLSDPTVVTASGDLRLQDGWKDNADIKAIATNPNILALLGRLYGRPAFAFQTLNFPVGTQQHPHSDSVHFSSLPERFMCGVWVAFEDIRPEAGPLVYYPGSHRWPITTNALIGRRGWGSSSASAQHPYEQVWRAMIAATGVEASTFLARKGQALIWAANLLHGGQARIDRALTRWSQVTHYYFDDCIYYTPAFSDELVGKLDLRELTDIATGDFRRSSYLGERLPLPRRAPPKKLAQQLRTLRRKLLKPR